MTRGLEVGDRRERVTAALALTSAAVAGALAAVGQPLLSAAVPYAALAAPMLLLAVASRGRLQRAYMSPPWIVCAALGVTGALGYAFHDSLHLLGGASVSIEVGAELAERTVYLFASLSGSIAVGALAVSVWRRRSEDPPLHLPSRRLRGLALLACAVPVVGAFLNYGNTLLLREEHLAGPEDGTGEANLYTPLETLGIGGVAILGYLFAVESRGRRFAAALLFVLYIGLAFALSSRRLALYPALFAVGYMIAARGRRSRWVLASGVAASVLLLPVPLFLRGIYPHGLEPYVAAIGQFSYGDVDWLASMNNVLVSFPITAFSAFLAPPAAIDWLWVELSPLPGGYVGWYDIAPELRINWATPFSTVGGLGNYGTGAVIGVGLALGVLLAYLDGRVGHYLRHGAQVVALVLVGMSGLLAVNLLQYNVRSSARLLLYALVLDLVLRVFVARRTARSGLPVALDEQQPLVVALGEPARGDGQGRLSGGVAEERGGHRGGRVEPVGGRP